MRRATQSTAASAQPPIGQPATRKTGSASSEHDAAGERGQQVARLGPRRRDSADGIRTPPGSGGRRRRCRRDADDRPDEEAVAERPGRPADQGATRDACRGARDQQSARAGGVERRGATRLHLRGEHTSQAELCDTRKSRCRNRCECPCELRAYALQALLRALGLASRRLAAADARVRELDDLEHVDDVDRDAATATQADRRDADRRPEVPVRRPRGTG